jgi:hypothetical protein
MFLVLLVVYAISYAGIMVVELGAAAVVGIGSLLGSLVGVHAGSPAAIAVMIVFGTLGFLALMAVMALSWSSYAITSSVLYADRRQMDGAIEPVRSGGAA